MKKLLLILLFVPLIFSCGNNENNNQSNTKIERIIKPTNIQLETIVSGLEQPTASPPIIIGKSCAIKSKDFEDVYFVAVMIYKYYKSWDKKEEIGVGVWSLGGSGGSCYSVNDLAIRYSVWPNVNISMYDEGALDVKRHIKSGKGYNIVLD